MSESSRELNMEHSRETPLRPTLLWLQEVMTTALQSPQWSDPLHPCCKFVLFRLLSVLTWSEPLASDWSPPDSPESARTLSITLGRVWDGITARPHQTRGLIVKWVQWASRANSRTAEAWSGLSPAKALDLLRLARRAGKFRRPQPRQKGPVYSETDSSTLDSSLYSDDSS